RQARTRQPSAPKNETSIPNVFRELYRTNGRTSWMELRDCHNPKGIVSSSPGLRGTSYPGDRWPGIANPNGVAARSCFHQTQLRWGVSVQRIRYANGWSATFTSLPRGTDASMLRKTTCREIAHGEAA